MTVRYTVPSHIKLFCQLSISLCSVINNISKMQHFSVYLYWTKEMFNRNGYKKNNIKICVIRIRKPKKQTSSVCLANSHGAIRIFRCCTYHGSLHRKFCNAINLHCRQKEKNLINPATTITKPHTQKQTYR